MITLERLLESRDRRQSLQQKLLRENPGRTLLCLTVVMPGNVKRNRQSLTVAHAAVEELRKAFGDDILLRDLDTGYEAYMLTDRPADETKREACRIEDSHPLGRLFDIDVLDGRGLPLSRTALGLSGRRCLICGDDARICMRLQRHDYTELTNHIARMIDDYEC